MPCSRATGGCVRFAGQGARWRRQRSTTSTRAALARCGTFRRRVSLVTRGSEIVLVEWRSVLTRPGIDGTCVLARYDIEGVALVDHREFVKGYARWDSSATLRLQKRTVTEWEDAP